MKRRRDRVLISKMLPALTFAWLVAIPSGALAQRHRSRSVKVATNPIRYQVNYRPSANDPWQLYAATRGLDKANAIAAEVQSTGYLAQVVNNLTPSPQPYPDAAETSASSYYPTSNWSSDYNYYIVPGRSYNYGWYGGWNPRYGYRSYPNYWWNGNRSFYGAGYGGHYWGGGWRRGGGWGGAGWSGGAWSGNHRNWNNSHVDRGTHNASHEQQQRGCASPVSRPAYLRGPSSAGSSRGGAACEPFVVGTSWNRPPWRRRRHADRRPSRGRPSRGRPCGPWTRREAAADIDNSPGRHAAGHHGRHHDP